MRENECLREPGEVELEVQGFSGNRQNLTNQGKHCPCFRFSDSRKHLVGD